jgi:hypothetical protein
MVFLRLIYRGIHRGQRMPSGQFTRPIRRPGQVSSISGGERDYSTHSMYRLYCMLYISMCSLYFNCSKNRLPINNEIISAPQGKFSTRSHTTYNIQTYVHTRDLGGLGPPDSICGAKRVVFVFSPSLSLSLPLFFSRPCQLPLVDDFASCYQSYNHLVIASLRTRKSWVN